MTDIHTHILFDIDDGAKDFEMSMKMLEAEKQEGAKAVVLTPHFDLKKQNIKEFLSLRSSGAEKLKSTSSLKFLEAAEVRAYPFISKYEHLGSLCIEGTNAILLELPETGFASWIQPMIYSLQLSGFTPVLAHIERYPYLHKIKNLKAAVTSGALTQVTASAFLENSYTVKRFLKKAADENLIHFIASDCHSDTCRPPNLKSGYEAAEKILGAQFVHNAKQNSDLLVSRGFIRHIK